VGFRLHEHAAAAERRVHEVGVVALDGIGGADVQVGGVRAPEQVARHVVEDDVLALLGAGGS
jgi:hypothetical protein